MKLLLTFWAASALATAAVAGNGYIRPQIAYVIPTESTADAGYGAFLGIGYAFGNEARHNIELEVGWASWDAHESATDGETSLDGAADIGLVPILINYRYNAAISPSLTGYVQAGIGYAAVATDISIFMDGSEVFDESDDDGAAAAGVGVGLAWTVGQTMSAHIGYRYLAVASLQFEIYDLTVESFDNNVHLIEAGLTFRF